MWNSKRFYFTFYPTLQTLKSEFSPPVHSRQFMLTTISHLKHLSVSTNRSQFILTTVRHLKFLLVSPNHS